jgi:hypothetical protein
MCGYYYRRHLYAELDQPSKDLDLVLRNKLCEGDKDPGLEAHQPVVFRPEPKIAQVRTDAGWNRTLSRTVRSRGRR